MDVINDNAALLSNYEVFSVLRKCFHNRQKDSEASKHLATISYETLRYLEQTPCRHQSPSVLENFAQAIAPFELMKAERLQLLNLRPASEVVLYLLVEEIDSRVNLEELLKVVTTCLPDEKHNTSGIMTDSAVVSTSNSART